MKAKALQFGKAISAALFVLLLVAVGSKNALAQTQVATLQRNGDIIGAYYGENALKSAYNAASNGDIITLSSGTFSCNDIEKNVTIRGAGCMLDQETNVKKTEIFSTFRLHAPNASFEGIHFSGTINCQSNGSNSSTKISFVKCVIYTISELCCNGPTYNINFINCIVNNCNCANDFNLMLGLSLINSVVRFTSYGHTNIYYPTTIYNSVVLFNNDLIIKNIIAYNSIIATMSGHEVSNCTFFNCINIKAGETSLFDGQTCSNVMEVDGYDDVFETFNGTVSYDNIYQLKNDIATDFLGHDGTEVGIYGGLMPYSTRLHYMIIRNCNVAGRTTIDNKLSVEIELLNEDE